VNSATVGVFDGSAVVSSAEIAWAPQDHWAVQGEASDINPGRVREDLPGKLDFQFDAEGNGYRDKDDFAVDIRNLTGRLRGSAATGGGHVARKGAAWELDRVRLSLGRTNLSADGRIADAFDLRFAVEAEDLSLLKQESRGKLKGQGTLHGTWADPIVNAELHGSDLEHEGVKLAAIDGKIDFDASGSRPSNIDVQAR